MPILLIVSVNESPVWRSSFKIMKGCSSTWESFFFPARSRIRKYMANLRGRGLLLRVQARLILK